MSSELLIEQALFEEIHQFILSEGDGDELDKAKEALSTYVVSLEKDPDFDRGRLKDKGAVAQKVLDKIKKFLGSSGRFIVKFLGLMAVKRVERAKKDLTRQNVVAELKPLVSFMFQAAGGAAGVVGVVATGGAGGVFAGIIATMKALFLRAFGKVIKKNIRIVKDAAEVVVEGTALFIFSKMMEEPGFAQRISTSAPRQIATTSPDDPTDLPLGKPMTAVTLQRIDEQQLYNRWKLIAGIK